MKTLSQFRTRAALFTALPGLIAALAMPAMATAQTPKGSGELRVVAVESNEKDGGKDGDKSGGVHKFEIRIEDGKVSVKRDGKEVPDSEVRNENGRITIVDQHGNPIDLMLNGDSAWSTYLGDNAFKWTTDSSNENPPKVMLGVHMGEPGPALEHHLKLEPGTTTMIIGIYEGLPADAAGLAQYDVITKVNGQSPADAGAIKEALSKTEPGDTVTFAIIHEGKAKDVKVKLGKYDAEAMQKAKLIGQEPQDQFWSWSTGKESDLKSAEGMYKRLFVAPGPNSQFDLQKIAPSLKPLIEKRLHDSGQGQGGDVDDQLQRLDKRMDDLEKMLQKLIDRQERNR